MRIDALPPTLQAREASMPAADSAYSAMINTLRVFLDHLADAQLDEERAAALDRDLLHWAKTLDSLAVSEKARMFGRAEGVPGRAQVMSPALVIVSQDATSVRARVTFGSYFLGFNGAAHGGSVALLFDEVLGIVGNVGVETIARTANLDIDFRAITPVCRELDVTANLISVHGRKRFVRGEIRDGETLCAEAEGLFLELQTHQQ